MNLFLIAIFGLVSFFGLAINVVIFHHLKKFSLPKDPFPMKILAIFKRGSIVLIFFSFVLLIFLFL